METQVLYFTIVVIGVITFFQRAIFLFVIPKFAEHPLVKKGMNAVPAAMLVALVVPFTLFIDQRFNPVRAEVWAIMISVPLIYYSKKYALGLPIALFLYYLIEFFYF